MEDFPFNFNLNYKKENFITKPPPNYSQLKEIASKKYEIKIEEMAYINEEEEETVINNEQDYADLIEYVTNHNLKEINILINREKKDNEEGENSNEEGGRKEGNLYGFNNEEEIGINCDYDFYGDTRNRKANHRYTNHNWGFKEQKRIAYILEKKNYQREETSGNIKKKKKNKNKKKK